MVLLRHYIRAFICGRIASQSPKANKMVQIQNMGPSDWLADLTDLNVHALRIVFIHHSLCFHFDCFVLLLFMFLSLLSGSRQHGPLAPLAPASACAPLHMRPPSIWAMRRRILQLSLRVWLRLMCWQRVWGSFSVLRHFRNRQLLRMHDLSLSMLTGTVSDTLQWRRTPL